MFTRWSLRTRSNYNLVLGTCLTVSGTIAFVLESHAAVIGIILGLALITSGLVLRGRWKAQQIKQPPTNSAGDPV